VERGGGGGGGRGSGGGGGGYISLSSGQEGGRGAPAPAPGRGPAVAPGGSGSAGAVAPRARQPSDADIFTNADFANMPIYSDGWLQQQQQQRQQHEAAADGAMELGLERTLGHEPTPGLTLPPPQPAVCAPPVCAQINAWAHYGGAVHKLKAADPQLESAPGFKP
jgi:hypothetical protein